MNTINTLSENEINLVAGGKLHWKAFGNAFCKEFLPDMKTFVTSKAFWNGAEKVVDDLVNKDSADAIREFEKSASIVAEDAGSSFIHALPSLFN